MKTRVALAATAVVLFSACQDAVAPRETGMHRDDRPMFDHQSHSFAIAFQACGDGGGVYECFIWVQEGEGTARLYGNGIYPVFNEDGIVTGAGSWLASPTWSPDVAKVAVDNGADILVITLSDSSFTTLTNHPARDHSPAWSPAGNEIAFISDRDGVPSLYLMRATDGGGVTRLTSGVEVRSQLTWSPDGSRLAFTCVVESGNADICAVNADGTGFARLTSASGGDFDPDWSPDGSRIAFVTNRFTTGATDIATMTPDGGNVTLISRPSLGAYYGYANLDWSPDGTRIAYSKTAYQPSACDAYNSCYLEPGVFVMNADGSEGGSIGNGTHPQWQPGGVVPPPTTDQPPVARLTYTCTYLDCYLFGSSSTDDHGIGGYRWNFGDGTTDYNYDTPYANIFHRYAAPGTYQVTLTVTDWDGRSASTTQAVTVQSQFPVATFSWRCGAGRACSFNSSASSDDLGIISRTWTFGDGSSVNDVIEPSHTYSVNGSYQVTLTVRDASGQSSSVTNTVTVLADNAPVARFTYSCSNGTCVFDGRASTDDWGIASYRWEIGRQIAAGAVVTMAFKGRPTITGTLTVTDQAGQTNSATQTVTIR